MLSYPPHIPGNEMPTDQDRAERKEVVKEALKEWLDDKFLSFGKWSAAAVAASFLAAAVYFIFWMEFKK